MQPRISSAHRLILQCSRGLTRPTRFGATAPTLEKLRFDFLAAAGANPGVAGGDRDRPGKRAERESFVYIVDIKLRPRFHHRQVAQGAGKILVAQFALDTGRDEHVARVRDL
jgi:hypothetical protein